MVAGAAGVVGRAASDGAACAPAVSIPAGSGATRLADERSVTDHTVVPTTTTTATAPKATHVSRRRRRTAGGGRLDARHDHRAGRLGLLDAGEHTSTIALRTVLITQCDAFGAPGQLARFSGGGAAASAAARSFTEAAYMST